MMLIAMILAAATAAASATNGPCVCGVAPERADEWDGENKGVTQITFEVAMPPDGDAHLAVTFDR
jgi:hypothetical protein